MILETNSIFIICNLIYVSSSYRIYKDTVAFGKTFQSFVSFYQCIMITCFGQFDVTESVILSFA